MFYFQKFTIVKKRPGIKFLIKFFIEFIPCVHIQKIASVEWMENTFSREKVTTYFEKNVLRSRKKVVLSHKTLMLPYMLAKRFVSTKIEGGTSAENPSEKSHSTSKNPKIPTSLYLQVQKVFWLSARLDPT